MFRVVGREVKRIRKYLWVGVQEWELQRLRSLRQPGYVSLGISLPIMWGHFRLEAVKKSISDDQEILLPEEFCV